MNGAMSFVEVTVESVLAADVMERAGSQPLSAARDAEKRKLSKYDALARERGYGLRVLALESTGALGKQFGQFIDDCEAGTLTSWKDQTANIRTHSSRSFATFWQQALSIAFWTGTMHKHLRHQRFHGPGNTMEDDDASDTDNNEHTPTEAVPEPWSVDILDQPLDLDDVLEEDGDLFDL